MADHTRMQAPDPTRVHSRFCAPPGLIGCQVSSCLGIQQLLNGRMAMDGPKSFAAGDRAQLRRQWIQQAVAAFEEMFAGPGAEAELVTFSQREQMAGALGKELSRWLLE